MIDLPDIEKNVIDVCREVGGFIDQVIKSFLLFDARSIKPRSFLVDKLPHLTADVDYILFYIRKVDHLLVV